MGGNASEKEIISLFFKPILLTIIQQPLPSLRATGEAIQKKRT